MAAGVRLTYGTLTLESSEIIDFSWNRKFNINTMATVALIEITQPGNLSPIELSINSTIRKSTSTKFTSWTNLLTAKTLAPLTFLNRSLGNFYLSEVDIKSAELDDAGDVLRMDMGLLFIGNQNYQ